MAPKRVRGGRPVGATSTSIGSHSSPPPFTSSPPRGDVEENDDEAVQEDRFEDVLDPTNVLDDEEKDGEDLFGPGHQNDYKAMPELDRYDTSDIDDAEYAPINPRERQKVEAALRERDRLNEPITRGLPAAFVQTNDDDEDGGRIRMPPRRRRRTDASQPNQNSDGHTPGSDGGNGGDGAGGAGEDDVQLTDYDVRGHSVREWIALDTTRRKIRFQFRDFLTTTMDEKGHNLFEERIKAMCESNGESLEVSFVLLHERAEQLAKFLAKAPVEMLKIFDEVAFEVVKFAFQDYDRIHSEIHVRITELPTVDSLRDLRHNHLNSLVRVSGVVTRRTAVFPQLKYVKYDCGKCGNVLGPFYQDTQSELRVGSCPECQSKGPFAVNAEQTIYRNYQRLTLQEAPGSVTAGRLPRQKDVILLWDLIDAARPGEEIEVTGVYRNTFDVSTNNKNGFPVFQTVIEANFVAKKEDLFASFRLTEDDEREIRKLAKDDHIGERIVKSIAPSIYGHVNIKRAIAMALFGGQSKDVQGKHRLRGDINVLMLGDPGTAKSQFLKYVEKTAHRAVYATGQGASAVGLTASVRKDPITREWTLEGGALVLADKGVCLIDEFDKMNDSDRTSIHEAMEQQSISISKAGIVTSLQARCAVIAAANPSKGRYDSSLPFSENVELTDPILSRFDVLCVVKDIVDPQQDEKLSTFVINSHMKSHPEYDQSSDNAGDTVEPEEGAIRQDLLRKYIMYAREKVHPKLQNIDQSKLSNLFAELRRESLSSGSIPITVRHIESIIRMSEANARMHLRDIVRSDDVDTAISVCLESFISAQKFSILKQMKKTFARYISSNKDSNELLFYLLQGLVRENVNLQRLRNGDVEPSRAIIAHDDFLAKAKEHNIHDVRDFLESKQFVQGNFRYYKDRKEILYEL